MKQGTSEWETTATSERCVQRPGGGDYARVARNGKRTFRQRTFRSTGNENGGIRTRDGGKQLQARGTSQLRGPASHFQALGCRLADNPILREPVSVSH